VKKADLVKLLECLDDVSDDAPVYIHDRRADSSFKILEIVGDTVQDFISIRLDYIDDDEEIE
jgi:hypothetical protein